MFLDVQKKHQFFNFSAFQAFKNKKTLYFKGFWLRGQGLNLRPSGYESRIPEGIGFVELKAISF